MITKNKTIMILIGLMLCFSVSILWSQEPYRAGTTSANFLELGYGSAGLAMGDACVSVVNDISAIYWNPAGLGYMKQNQFQAMYQPWIAGINSSFIGLGYVHPLLGTFGIGIIQMSFGEEEVTSILMQDGTGENFDGQDFCASFSYGRKLADWFAFGASGKYISSRIWHEKASAVAFDLGAIVETGFFTWSGEGLKIGMSISNYGSKLKYDGIDLKQPVDISPEDQGNFKYVPARFEVQGWELPLIFRIGVSLNPIVTSYHRLTVAVDALHPNNNSEYINLGTQYALTLPRFGIVSLRAGYKGLEMIDSEYGFTFGFGLELFYLNNKALRMDYAFRDIGILGRMHSYTLSLAF